MLHKSMISLLYPCLQLYSNRRQEVAKPCHAVYTEASGIPSDAELAENRCSYIAIAYSYSFPIDATCCYELLKLLATHHQTRLLSVSITSDCSQSTQPPAHRGEDDFNSGDFRCLCRIHDITFVYTAAIW